jgi:hypothetical protein
MNKGTILGAALGQCVHVGGIDHFLRLAEDHGWKTRSMGAAVAPRVLLAAVAGERPEVVAVSYRLTPGDAVPLFEELKRGAGDLPAPHPRWVFGGTPPVAALARASGLFEAVFDGASSGDPAAWLRGSAADGGVRTFAGDLPSRVAAAAPFPILRHHYGEPDLARTVAGARRIAEAEVLDVLSIGPDQNAQEHFFRPGEMDPRQDGAGGVPLRRPEDLRSIYEATRCGNFPLVRCYSGTRDLIPWAEMSVKEIRNAWAAIPLCWYSEMDGRSKVPFPDAIREKQAAMRWYAEHGVPVEVNESHQWSLRDAHDALAVAMAFLAAYNARAQGVRTYVVQMMHNTPPSTSPGADLAKMLAKLELIREIEGPEFRTLREVRAGITSLPSDPHEAKGHVAASAVYSMAVRPDILHVVGFSEAHGVADPSTIMESCRIARGAVRLSLQGAPNMASDPAVGSRRDRDIGEARVILEAVRRLGPSSPDPWSDAEVLTKALLLGVLDAPHFRGHPRLKGGVVTACVDGGWEAIDPETRRPLTERERIGAIDPGLV